VSAETVGSGYGAVVGGGREHGHGEDALRLTTGGRRSGAPRSVILGLEEGPSLFAMAMRVTVAHWTPRVRPGGLLVDGELVGTWRRAQGTVTVQTWRRLSRAARDADEAEAASLPLPGIRGVTVRWDE